MYCSARDLRPTSQLRDGVQRGLDDADEVWESGREVVDQQDDRRETEQVQGGPGERGQEEEEADYSRSSEPELHLLFQLELWDLSRQELQEKASLLSGDQAGGGLSGETQGPAAQFCFRQNLQFQEVKETESVLLNVNILDFNTITSLPDTYYDGLNNIFGFYLLFLVVYDKNLLMTAWWRPCILISIDSDWNDSTKLPPRVAFYQYFLPFHFFKLNNWFR